MPGGHLFPCRSGHASFGCRSPALLFGLRERRAAARKQRIERGHHEEGKQRSEGHAANDHPADLLATLGAIEAGLRQCGYKFELGAGVAAAQAAYRDPNILG